MSGAVSRPWNVPGMTRDNAISTAIDPGMLARAVGGLKSFLGFTSVMGSPETPFFPPGKPMTPTAPGAAGRRFDYPTAVNIYQRPRTNEGIDFDTLRAIADPVVGGYDLIRLAIETRKDQMSKLEWSVLPRKKTNVTMRPKSDERCEAAEVLLRRPDGHTPWQQWVSQLIEEQLVIDAPCIYRRRALDGSTIRLELMDGATIVPKLNYDGRRPEDGTAYQQILKGLPAVDYSKDDILYMPRNPRVNKIYGMSVVEQVLVTVNIGLRRQAGQLAFFTDGNIPDAISAVPEAWTTEQIAQFQAYWDTMVNDAVTRRKMKFVPAGTAFQMTRATDALVDQFDEWLARIIAYAFSLPPTPFVKMNNRATAETAYETALSEGLQPLMIWLKSAVDYILANWLDTPDLELVWDQIKKPDPKEKEERDLIKVDKGIISRDDMRGDLGLEPLGIGPIVTGFGPLGFMSIAAMKKAIDNGWDLTGLPQPGLGPNGEMGAIDPSLTSPGNDGPAADLSQLGTGGPGDVLNGLPPELLEALGVNSQPQGIVPAQTNSGAPAGQPALPAPGIASGATQGAMAPGTPGAGLTAPPPGGTVPSAGKSGNVVPLHKRPDVQQALRHGHETAKRMAEQLGAR